MCQLVFGEELSIVRGDGQYPPNEMIINGKLKGVHIDLVREIAAILNIKIIFRSEPWKRAISMIKNGEADAITYISKSPEREAFTYFLEGNIISYTENVFIAWKGEEKLIKYDGNLEKLKPYRIGTLRGYFYGEEFDKAQYLKKHVVDKMEQIVGLLRIKRIDLAIVNVTDFKYEFKEDPMIKNIIFLKPYFSKLPNYIGFSKVKNHEQLAKQFSETMNAFKQTEKYYVILERYGLK